MTATISIIFTIVEGKNTSGIWVNLVDIEWVERENKKLCSERRVLQMKKKEPKRKEDKFFRLPNN